MAAVDPKAAAAKKAPAPAGKPDPKKAGGALEEITDNRPRIISLTKDFAAEAGGLGLKINEDLAKRIADTLLKVEVYDVNRETQEETLKDSVTIDISSLLYPSTPNVEIAWTFDKLKIMQLHYLTFKIQSDQPLLSEFLRKKLNPLQINLLACKDIPYKTEHKYKPIHCVVRFIDGRAFRTLDHPQQPFIKFLHKHVFLLGLHDPVMLKELLATHVVKVDLHDCDEYVPPEDEKDAKFSIGQAKYTFKDLLRPNCKELKLRSDVFPVKRELQDNTQNLDLNTTAKKGERGIEKFSPYLINATYAVLTAEMAYPIGSFNEEAELKKVKALNEKEDADEKMSIAPSVKGLAPPSMMSLP